MPARVAARPRDPRGYPVPAITPWEDGAPRFAMNGVARAFLCGVERRCSICGLEMPDGPVYRVVGGAEAQAMAEVRASGATYHNQAPTAEAPGHRTCMLYAAVTCPYLARPQARRGQAVAAAGFAADRGEARGAGGAVAGFDTYEVEYTGSLVLFRFSGLRELLPHERGAEQASALSAGIAAEPVPVEPAPPYLLDDEAAAQRRFDEYLARFPV